MRRSRSMLTVRPEGGVRPVPHPPFHFSSKIFCPQCAMLPGRKLQGGSGVPQHSPDPQSTWTRLGRIQHLQYSGSAWGRQPPEGSRLPSMTFHSWPGAAGSRGRSTAMKRHFYRERDYAFGQVMLTLRTRIGLTQAGMADLLQISRHAVGEWEAGVNYPKAHHLQHVIELCVRASV